MYRHQVYFSIKFQHTVFIVSYVLSKQNGANSLFAKNSILIGLLKNQRYQFHILLSAKSAGLREIYVGLLPPHLIFTFSMPHCSSQREFPGGGGVSQAIIES